MRTCEDKEKEGDDGHVTEKEECGDVVLRVHVLHVVVNAVQKHVTERCRVRARAHGTQAVFVRAAERRDATLGGAYRADDPDTKNERHHQ